MAGTVEVLVDSFQLSGTPFNVGHPRGESVELMDAARRAGMRFILMKQATAAAMLAVTLGRTHRLSRRLPVDLRAGHRQHGQRHRARLATTVSHPATLSVGSRGWPGGRAGCSSQFNQTRTAVGIAPASAA